MSIYFQHTFQRSFGTYPLTGEVLHEAIKHAAQVGYRAFDTAQMYGNEADTGTALAALGLARDEICITTKVHPENFSEAAFIPSVEESLKNLQLSEVDVLLLHWPPIGGDIAPSLKRLQQAQQQGLARHIGVSNYTAQMMRDAAEIIDSPLVCNQVEYHPLINQDTLLAAAVETGIALSSYCSIARGKIFEHALFCELGNAYGKNAAQIALRWILQKGVAINTMSSKPKNIAANFAVMDFSLSNVDMARIDALTQRGYRIVTAEVAPWAPEWD